MIIDLYKKIAKDLLCIADTYNMGVCDLIERKYPNLSIHTYKCILKEVTKLLLERVNHEKNNKIVF